MLNRSWEHDYSGNMTTLGTRLLWEHDYSGNTTTLGTRLLWEHDYFIPKADFSSRLRTLHATKVFVTPRDIILPVSKC
ncbi:hypothetical protein BgiBS90_023467 [Biomphalaria glabrata]|nr:hypothetical protein BgiBS90_023467 [Biomphalaria glabrata]